MLFLLEQIYYAKVVKAERKRKQACSFPRRLLSKASAAKLKINNLIYIMSGSMLAAQLDYRAVGYVREDQFVFA